jgi:hypothetical protein
MTAYAKELCAQCGELVSTFPPLKAKHDKTCKGAEKVAEVRKLDPAKIKDKIARERYEKALKKQTQLLEAPDVFAAEAGLDEHEVLVRAYAPECLGKNATHHAYIGDPREADVDAQKGYLIVFDDDGNQVFDRGQPLYTLPLELHEARVRAAQNESKARLGAADVETEKLKEMSKQQGVKIEQQKTITEERLSDG